MLALQEGSRIIVLDGEYEGRHGKVVLTHDGKQPVLARLIGIRPEIVRVALDETQTEESIALPILSRWLVPESP